MLSFIFVKQSNHQIISFLIFKELLLAEEWAKHHNLPFPRIDPTRYDREGMKECYIFHDEDQPEAPIVMHFMLANVNYRRFSEPGEY